MEEINWDYWLDMATIKDWQASALSLGINPKRIMRLPQSFGAAKSFKYAGDANLGEERLTAFINRLDLIQNNMHQEKFSLGLDEVYLQKFVAWALTKRTFKDDFPMQLTSMVIPDDKKIRKIEDVNMGSRILKPIDWNPLAEKYADELLNSNSSMNIDEVAVKIADRFKNEKIISVQGKPFDWETIKRHLSNWGFALKKIQANKK